MNQPKTSKAAPPAAEPPEAAPSDWGLDAPKKRGGSETRIALLLIVSLIGALGYVTYRKLDERRKGPHSGDFHEPAVAAATENGLEPSAPGDQHEPAPETEFSWEAGPGDAATAGDPSDRNSTPNESGDFWSSLPEQQQETERGAPRTFADDRATEFLTAQASSDDQPQAATQTPESEAAWNPFASETPLDSPTAEQPTTADDAVMTQASELRDSAQPFAAVPVAESGFAEDQATWSSDQAPAGANAASLAHSGEAEPVAGLPPVSETESEPVMDLFEAQPEAEPDAPALFGDSTADEPATGPLLEPLRVPADDARVMPVASEAAAHDVAPISGTDATGNNPWESAEPRELAQNTGKPVPMFDLSESSASANDTADGASSSSGFLPEVDRAAAATSGWDGGPTGSQAAAASGSDPFTPGVAESATSASGAEQLCVHTVQSGDNFWTIAHTYYRAGRFANALAAFNQARIPDPRKMRPGMKVLIPDRQVLIERFPKLTGAAYGPAPAPESARAGFFVDRSGQPCYRVGKNDTLTEIAARHLGRSSRWVQVLGMNRDQLQDPGNLKVGMVLKLPLDATQVSVVAGSTVAR